MKEHYCSVEKTNIFYQDKCNWCNESETSMKLYEVPRNTRIVLEGGTELMFDHIDGMYSVCYTDSGSIVHLAAWTEVTIKEDK